MVNKKIMSAVIVLAMILSMIPAFAGMANAEYPEALTISMCVLDAEKANISAKDEWFREKFNVNWELYPVTWGDWTEKVRAWVAADDMPDILWWDMKVSHTSEFRTWASAGAFREIPADLSAWPNLAALREVLDSDDRMLSIDNKLYGWPASRSNPEWVHNVYYPMFSYRRDWAKAVGLYKEGDMYTWDEAKALIKAVQAQDPGDNGAGNTIGITSETWAFPGVYTEVGAFSENRNPYVKIDGAYVPYFTTDAYRNELKFVTDLFQGGYIWKDQVVDSGSDGANNYQAGKSFMHLGNNSPDWLSGTYQRMLDAGVIASTDDIGPMIVPTTMDNKTFYLTQTEDYWTVSHITHSVSDAKLTRILDMWNYLASADGREFLLAGIEGKDYEKNTDGTMTILWPKNAQGIFASPYADNSFNIYTPARLTPSPNETTNMAGYEAFAGVFDIMKTSPDYKYHPLDWDVVTFGGTMFAQYGSFSSDVTAKVTEIIVGGGDVDAQWDAFLAEMQPKWQPVADELTAALG